MGRVGIEPTRIAPTDLKPVALTTRPSSLKIIFFYFICFFAALFSKKRIYAVATGAFT